MNMDTIRQRVREELPFLDLVRAVVEACREADAAAEGALDSDEGVQDVRGYLRKAMVNEALVRVAQRTKGLTAKQKRNDGMLHHVAVESASFLVTPKLISQADGPIPRANYRQNLALEMPLFAEVCEDEEDQRAYFVLAYSMNPKDHAVPSWIALRDLDGICPIDLNADLERVLAEDENAEHQPAQAAATPAEVARPSPRLRKASTTRKNA